MSLVISLCAHKLARTSRVKKKKKNYLTYSKCVFKLTSSQRGIEIKWGGGGGGGGETLLDYCQVDHTSCT
jgi:hypothetical protein